MSTTIEILNQYLASKVEGRSEFCPRKGIYKVISVYEGTCLGRPALMAVAKWKPYVFETYTETTFNIQLESFKLNANADQQQVFKTSELAGREIRVDGAAYFSDSKTFKLTWDFLPQTMLEKLNQSVNLGSFPFDLGYDDLDCGYFVDNGEDY